MATDTPAEQTAPATEAPQTEGATPTTPEIPEALTQRLDELTSQVNDLKGSSQFRGGLTENVTQPPQEPDPYGTDPNQGFDPYAPPEGFDQYGNPADPYGQMPPQQAEQAAMAQLNQFIQQAVQDGVNQHVTPFIRQQQAQQLEQRYPALADPKVAGPLVEQAGNFARQLGQPELGLNPQFIENFYLAQQARERAAQETPADGDQGVHLEGGGAIPAAEEKSAGDRMLEAWNIPT